MITLPDADVLGIAALLPPEERAILDRLTDFLHREVTPHAIEWWNEGSFPRELLPGLAELDIIGLASRGYSHLLGGLVALELTRCDTSIATFFGVHDDLFGSAIRELASADQRARWLPEIGSLRRIGAFALTEPGHGSDVARELETRAERVGDDWRITGRKRWIGNGTIADYCLVWARDAADDELKAFVVDTAASGFTATSIRHKVALRITQNADITLDGVLVPDADRLPGSGFAAVNRVLRGSRTWVAWQTVGQQLAAYDLARAYALEREQFGRPIAAFQLVQEQLVRMLGNATASFALLSQIARLQDEGSHRDELAALAKSYGAARMRETVAIGRNIFGGNGISTEFGIAKVWADAEAIYAYEGSQEVNTLIVGRAITGHSAFR